MKTRLLLLSLFIAGVCATWAQGPNGSGTYYQNADGKKGSELKTALFHIIKSHTDIGYNGLWEAYKKTDTRADGYVRDWYSNATNYRHITDKAGSYSKEGDCYNREHSVPQSWFNEAAPMRADIVHVVPSDGYVNNRRSNYPLAEVNSVTYSSKNNYCKLGSCKTEGYSGTVFEPNDETKGDFARMYFYMATCYQDKCNSWGNDVFSSQNLGLTNWYVSMLMRWSKQDPIDEVEIARNNAVKEVQGNRNPFVDYPGLEDYIWGTLKDKSFSYDNYEGGSGGGDVPTIATPVFSPDAGSYYHSVDVTLTCATEGASIYYTTNGADASVQSIPYEGPFTLTETATIKAVAVKNGKTSSQASATYTITGQGGGGDTPVSCEIALNNTLFGTNYGGSMGNVDEDLTGTKNGVSVIYAKGTGSNRYCNDSQIRIYPGNVLSLSVGQGTITALEFTMPESTTKVLKATTGSVSVDGTVMKWTGNSSAVDFSYDASSGHIKLSSVKVTVSSSSGPSSIYQISSQELSGKRVIYNLRGQRVTNPTRGIYIVDGRKVVIGE
jgi:endonuclease I